MPTLKEILNSNREVILDGSVERQSSFLWEIFESKNYSYLNPKDIRNEISSFQIFLNALEHPNARTTPEITQEIRTYAEKIGEKTSYLKCSAKTPQHRVKNKKYRKRNKVKKGKCLTDFFQTSLLNQGLLESLQEKVFYGYQISRGKKLEITEPDYKTFAEVIIQLERLLHLKQDTAYSIGISNKDNSHYSDTDERVTATILWQSMFSNHSPVLVTQDGDFIRLLGVLPRLLGSDTFLPYNQLFRKRMTENPVRLYYVNRQGGYDYKDYINSASIIFQSKFKLYKLTKEINNEMEKRVGEFWKQFSQSKP